MSANSERQRTPARCGSSSGLSHIVSRCLWEHRAKHLAASREAVWSKQLTWNRQAAAALIAINSC
jgi:hypothetical protein